jgi:cytochrome c oxidase assembly protein Cox11
MYHYESGFRPSPENPDPDLTIQVLIRNTDGTACMLHNLTACFCFNENVVTNNSKSRKRLPANFLSLRQYNKTVFIIL